MRWIPGIIFITGAVNVAYGQLELFRMGDVVEATFDGEILATNVYVTAHVPDLTGIGIATQNEMFQAGYARVRSQLLINEQFIIGLGLSWWGIYSGYPKKNYPFLSEAYIVSDTLHWSPIAQRAFIYGGRMKLNYGTGLMISDFYGVGYNTFGLTMQFREQQPLFMDLLYIKLSEGGGNQIDWTYFPVAYNTDSTKAYKWIYTKYDLETYGLILRKEKVENQPFALNFYLTTMLEDRDFAFMPVWTGFYLDVGPIQKFTLTAELGYLFGHWKAIKPIYNDFPDQLYTTIRGCDPAIDGDTCPGFKFSSLAYTINVRYDNSEDFAFGIGYSSFQGDNGTTPDVYEGWFSPTLRSELNVNSQWTRWSGIGEVFTFGLKPGLYRDIFGSNLSDIRILNLYTEASLYRIYSTLRMRVDLFAYWENWGPQYEFYSANPDDYPIDPNQPYALDIGYEVDLTFKLLYADFADIGIILGYFIPGSRMKYGWARPGSLSLLEKFGVLEDTQYIHTRASGSFIARFWIYRQINF